MREFFDNLVNWSKGVRGRDKKGEVVSIEADLREVGPRDIPWILVEESNFWVRGSMPIKNRSILNGHPWRMPHLIGIGAEKVPLRLILAERLVRNILIQFIIVIGICSLEAVERMKS